MLGLRLENLCTANDAIQFPAIPLSTEDGSLATTSQQQAIDY